MFSFYLRFKSEIIKIIDQVITRNQFNISKSTNVLLVVILFEILLCNGTKMNTVEIHIKQTKAK